ncbi:STAS/SEC14 domain-containing protein [Mucilaginibacter hurinus]|uniref:STAS/SEC14 domain-containing protein n=1 Tax=Mucilaginibacter hurinus TaxID=2201324 RepID=A0A367GQY5_9SPHI|nr:STAS/SEC14 domain-containing protein [Mucilaginibacter hurinus]RCH55852.1 STAS/SEC14 domain-containing protein [Mucilaginibacter hurinus]
MLRFINDMPGHVIGIHAVGAVTREDIESVLMPKFDELVEKQGEINYLLVLETDINNFTRGALLADVKLGLKHFTKWNRIAIVTDQRGVAWFSDAVRFLIPGQSKSFPLDKLDEAVIWVSEKISK